MGIEVALHHRTQYRYEKAVSLGPQVIQLRPAPHTRTRILTYALAIDPGHHLLNWQFDPFANHVARVIFPNKTTEFVVDVKLTADLVPVNPFGFLLEPGFETYPFTYDSDTAAGLEPYLSPEPDGPLLREWLSDVSVQQQGTLALLGSVNAQLCSDITYTTRFEHGVQTCEETLAERTGSCRDSSWLLVQVLRHLGYAARFASGYLIQLAENKPQPATGVTTADSADLHAWAEVFLPGAGWIGLDPTSGLFTAEGHIPLACMPTALQAAPIWGTVERAETSFDYTMTVRRINETASRVDQAVSRGDQP